METMTKTFANAPTLAERAHNIRRHALRMGEVQGQGYIAQALDISDVLATAYFHAMRRGTVASPVPRKRKPQPGGGPAGVQRFRPSLWAGAADTVNLR